MEGIYTGEEIKEIRKNAIHAGLKLVDCPIRHLGTEKAQQLYLAIQNYHGRQRRGDAVQYRVREHHP